MVDVALDAHSNLLQQRGGLLPADGRLLGGRAVPDRPFVEALIIDDWFGIQRTALGALEQPGLDDAAYSKAQDIYAKEGLPGSSSKAFTRQTLGTLGGAEVDSRPGLAAAGLVTVASPLERRMVLSLQTLRAAALPALGALAAAMMVGCWVAVFMFRRPLMVLLKEVFALTQSPMESVRALPRRVANELALA